MIEIVESVTGGNANVLEAADVHAGPGDVLQLLFFLICRRARRQRSQSPVLGTSRIDKHFELYNELKTKRKTKEFPISLSSDEAKEQTPFDSPIGRKDRGKLYNPATQFGHHARL